MDRPGRKDFVDGLRGLAALYVVLGHIATMVDPAMKFRRPGASPEWLSWLLSPLWYGHLAVAGFIVLSGFSLQLSLFNRGSDGSVDWGRFMRRRAERILPPYYACLALSLLVCNFVTSRQVGLPFSQYVPVTPGALWSHVFLVHNLNPDWMYRINGVLWSIAVEFQIYLLFPLLGFWMAKGRREMGWVLLALAVVAIVPLLLFPVAMKLYVWYLPLFGLGMFAARLLFSSHQKRVSHIIFVNLMSSGLLLAFVTLGAKLTPITDLFFALGLIGTLGSLELAPTSVFHRLLASRPLVRLGAFSYSLYLVHHPIMQVIFVYRPEWASTPVRQVAYLGAVGVPVILVLSYGFYWVFERPFVKARK